MTKKFLVIIAISISLLACEKAVELKETNGTKELKTAYVDTSLLMKEYQETKDVEARFKVKSENKGKQLEAQISLFKNEVSNFQEKAKANGQAWAEQKGAELQRREQQLGQAQQALSQELQQESAVEMDSLISGVKKFIKQYGKEKGYAYIYGTGDAATVLYAQDKYDITKDIIKLLNDKYNASEKKK
ncbi:OmpH family outer membrane protein [Flavobacterium sp.]|uniref:OmpH family outer membrane protein n=1 Tax=Flavobacterium sp. TaxID=239 RepID=UPI0038FC3C59